MQLSSNKQKIYWHITYIKKVKCHHNQRSINSKFEKLKAGLKIHKIYVLLHLIKGPKVYWRTNKSHIVYIKYIKSTIFSFFNAFEICGGNEVGGGGREEGGFTALLFLMEEIYGKFGRGLRNLILDFLEISPTIYHTILQTSLQYIYIYIYI